MPTNLLPIITFVLISTLSPGPTNIASAAALYGCQGIIESSGRKINPQREVEKA